MGGAILPILAGVAGLATGGLALGPALGLGAAAAEDAAAGTGAAAGAAAGAAGAAGGSGFNLAQTLGGIGSMAGGAAKLSDSLYNQKQPQMPGYSGSHSSLPQVDIKSLLQPVGGQGGGGMSPVPTLGSFRDNNLSHIIGQLSSGIPTDEN